MSELKQNKIPCKTTNFFSKINKIWFTVGLPNLWVVDVYNKKILKYLHRVLTLFISIFVSLDVVTLFIHSSSSFSEKQSNDRLLFGVSHPILMTYYIGLEYHKTQMRDVLTKLCITIKNIYNDPDVEIRMIKKASYYSIVFALSIMVSLVSYGFDALMQVIYSDEPFITVVTAWPDIEDKSTLADLARFFIYIIWWIFMTRISAVITLIITTTVALSQQYKNLQSYFYSLDDIFQNVNDENEQNECEAKYVEALKVGIKLHSDTLWCTRQCQVICSLVISGQITVNVTVVCLLMLQMVNSERTLVNALTSFCTAMAVLISTGFLMWNAGDITVEASLVPTAMFSSGWHHCRGPTSRIVRNLLVVAMTQGQKPVVLRSFGIAEISYESYLSIVKFTYSAFSLLY